MPLSTSQEDVRLVSQLYRDHINPDLARLIKFSGLGAVEVEAYGLIVKDHLGREFLDFSGGYGVFSLGHRHPRVVAAVREQLERMPLSSRVFFNGRQARLARRLANLSPGDLRYCFFCNSGTEAVEGAVKLARLATGRSWLISAQNAFHGKTLGSLSVSGRQSYREPFEPLLPHTLQVPFGDLDALKEAVDDNTAGVILEPVQGEGGIHVAPDGYLASVAQLCKERGALLIADEVQCGLGRTGRMFAVEHWGVEPDLLLLAKALGGGVMPVGAIIGNARAWQAFKGRPLVHTSTFGGNPMACAAAEATLEVLIEENLPARAAESGAYLLQGLEEIRRSFPAIIKETRGLGLMLGVELHKEEYAGSIITEMARRRIVAVYTLNQPRVIRFEPPLNVTREEIDRALEALAESTAETERRFRELED